MSKWVGVVALDPGGVSGYVQGVVPVRGSFAHRVERMKLRQAIEIPSRFKGYNGASDEMIAAINLFNQWRVFYDYCDDKGVPVVTVIEDFMLTKLGSSDRSGISTVRITEPFMLLVWQHLQAKHGRGMEWYAMPWFISVSTASAVGKDERLKNWGLWEKGKVHCRSAWRVWATYVREHSKQPTDEKSVRKACKGAGSVKRFKASGRY